MRCDTCAAQAAQAPQDVASLLRWLAPPLELVEALERWQASGKPMPEPVKAYLARWQALRTAEPVGAAIVDGGGWL